jgi:hypothetical protein
MCCIYKQLTFKSPGAQVSRLSVIGNGCPGDNSEPADEFGLASPLHQKANFDKANLYWTMARRWAVLGHWLINRKSTVRDLASVA